MGLSVFYKEDIANAIQAAEQATTAALPDTRYLEGYRAALTTIALAFGLADDDRAGLPSLTRGNGRMLALTRDQ